MTWLLNEDEAIKTKLAGRLSVTDENASLGSRSVVVRFRLPETELADMEFPAVIINPAKPSRASDREHRGPTTLCYIPDTVTGNARDQVFRIDPETGVSIHWNAQDDFDPNLSPFAVDDYPVPYNLDYTITVYARKQQHISQLVSRLARQDMLPERFGWLEVTQDETIRSLDLLGMEIQTDKDSQDKRVFRAVYSVRVASELTDIEVRKYENFVSTIDLTLSQVDAVPTQVYFDLDIRWPTQAPAGASLNAKWDTHLNVGINEQLLWDTKATVSTSLQTVWNVAAN